MSDSQAYENLTTEQKTLVNDRIIESFKDEGKLAIYNAAMKDAQSKGASQSDSFQTVLDAHRDELAEALKAGTGGFPDYKDTALNRNGVQDVQDLSNSRIILRSIRDQLEYRPDSNVMQYSAENMRGIVDRERAGKSFPFAGELPRVEGMAAGIKLADASEVTAPLPGQAVSQPQDRSII